jgi:hypothetical protein
MESIGLIKVKWQGIDYELPVSSSRGQTLHAAIATKFGIPPTRLKLLLKSRAFAPAESAELVQQAAATGSTVLVLGTAAVDHLDSMQNRARSGCAVAVELIT